MNVQNAIHGLGIMDTLFCPGITVSSIVCDYLDVDTLAMWRATSTLGIRDSEKIVSSSGWRKYVETHTDNKVVHFVHAYKTNGKVSHVAYVKNGYASNT